MAELALLVRNIVGDREQICVSQGNPHVLGLATGKTTRQMGVAKDASRPPAVHGLGHGVGVGHLALRRQLLLAVKALGEKARQHGKQEARMDGGGGGLTSPQAIWNDTTYRFPTSMPLAPGPTWSTMPQNSCPRISPLFICMMAPAKHQRLSTPFLAAAKQAIPWRRCRSLPQTVEPVTLRITSRSSMIFGFGTSTGRGGRVSSGRTR